jgi:hypothetical protein
MDLVSPSDLTDIRVCICALCPHRRKAGQVTGVLRYAQDACVRSADAILSLRQGAPTASCPEKKW